MGTRSVVIVTVSLLSISGHAVAQWSDDPAQNLAIDNVFGSQNQPKIKLGRGDAAGSAYISWFDGSGGYDVRLQRVSEAGVAAWAEGGVMVADRGFSGTQDYGFDVDADGNAWLAFRYVDESTSEIAVQKVAPDGTLLLNGGMPLVVSAGAGNSPRIAATSDGHAVVAWSAGADVQLVKISGVDGSTMWDATEVAGTGLANLLLDLHGSDAGSVIVSFSHGDSFFLAPKHLWVNKYGADGSPSWAAPTVVFDLAGLPLGNFPTFVSDGAGGAVLSWFSPNSDAYVQHVSSDGTARFAHNGVVASTHATNLQVSPALVHDAANDVAYLFWLERNQGQSQWGVYGQKVDGETGTRQWGEEGLPIMPLDGTERSFVNATGVPGGGAIVSWFEGGFGAKAVRAVRLDPAGSTLWGPIDVGSSPTDKGRLTAAAFPSGMMVAAWSDQRVDGDGGDIYAQNVNLDGTLGASIGCLCEMDGNAAQVDVFDLLAYLDLWFAFDEAANMDLVPEIDVFDLLAYLDCWFPASAGNPCP